MSLNAPPSPRRAARAPAAGPASRRGRRRPCLPPVLALLLLLPTAPARAGRIERTAAKAAEAHRAAARDALRGIARAEYSWPNSWSALIDVWFVADEASARHSLAAALALAREAPAERDPAALEAYLRSRGTRPDRAAARDVVTRAEEALETTPDEAPPSALEAEVRAADTEPGTLLALRRGLLLARILVLRDRFREAGDLADSLSEEARRLGWTWGALETGVRAGRLAFRASDFGVAFRRLDRVRRELPPGTPARRRAEILADLGAVAIEARELDAAEAFLGEAARAYGPDAPEAHVAEANLAELEGRQRRYAAALARIRRAEKGLEAAGAEWETDLAYARAAHGRLLTYCGRLEEGIALTKQALAVHARSEGAAEREAEGVCHANLASSLAELGRFPEARLHEKAALDIFRDVLKDERRVTETLGGQAERAWHEGRKEEALGIWTSQRDRARERGDAEVLARALLGIARASVDTGRAKEAEEPFAEARGLAEGLDDPLLLCEILGVGAGARLRAGDPAEAVARARRGSALLGKALEDFGDEMAARLRSARLDLYEVGTLAAVRADRMDDVLYFLDGARAGTLLAALGGRRAVAVLGVSPALAAERAEAAAAETLAARALEEARIRAGPGERGPEVPRREAAYSAAKVRRAEVEDAVLARRRALAARAESPDVSFRSLRAALAAAPDRGTTLVVYGVFPSEVLALVVRPERERLVRFPSGTDAEAVRRACAALLDPDSTVPWPARAAAARDLLVAPLALGPETKRLLVSPDGSMASLPFRALLPDATAVGFVPSASAWERLAEEGRRRGQGVVAVGGCDYDTRYDATAVAMEVHAHGAMHETPSAPARSPAAPRGPALGERRSGLPRLRESEAEARAIGTEPLIGPRANVPLLRERLARTRAERLHALHLACHGFVDDERPSLSALALTATEQDDGFLKIHDILGLDLSTDLVTLSACDTARGPQIRGEGLYSVARAFIAAGAPRVVASLWKVDDEAAAAFMRRFYEHYLGGASAAEALRRTQVEMRDGKVGNAKGEEREEFRAERSWAAWVLWGLAD